jgi:hypothetical protein
LVLFGIISRCRELSVTEPHDVELRHRLKKGWAKFGVMKEQLLVKAVPLDLRLRLFDAVVTPTVLYGCASWVMTESRNKQLATVQKKMLRAILGRRRKVDQTNGSTESWVDWIKRVTGEVKVLMATHSLQSWVDVRKIRAKAWLEKVRAMEEDRWAKRVLNWTPQGRRARGHPRARWLDEVKSLS